MKILVAEDENISRLILARTLKAAGHEVIAVGDGARALNAYTTQAPAVVITDWLMPELDGLELVKRIRAMKRQRYPWLVMLTARDFKANYAATMTAGVDDYLTKPLDPELLLVRIEVARRVLELHGEVSLLQRFIPLCMSCRAVRDTSEHWLELDEYFRRQTGVDFSHGYCPDCYFRKSVLPELERFEAAKGPVATDGAPGLDLAAYARVSRFDRDESPGLLHDLTAHLTLLGERLTGLERDRCSSAPGGAAQLALLARVAAALGAWHLHHLAASAADEVDATALRAELGRVSAALEATAVAA